MFNLGILTNGDFPNIEVPNFFQVEKFKIIEIENKYQLDKYDFIDGLVVYLNKKEDITDIIDWLVMYQLKTSLFIWIFSKEKLDYEKDILLGLGVNGVVETEKNKTRLFYLIKNTFERLSKSQSLSANDSETFLNPSNRSITVNDKEVLLTRSEYKLLELLFENFNVTVSYKDLANVLWPEGCENHITMLSNIIFHLRKKMKDIKKIEIITTRSIGYVLKDR